MIQQVLLQVMIVLPLVFLQMLIRQVFYLQKINLAFMHMTLNLSRKIERKLISYMTTEIMEDMKFQVCDVTRPLASVHEICENDYSVVFNPSWDPEGSYIWNNKTREKTKLTPKDGLE